MQQTAARPSSGPDEGYTAAREQAAEFAMRERALLAVTGPLRQKFLHDVLSNDVAGRRPGQGCLAALMDPKGHLLALLRVLVGADTVWLETLADGLGELERTLVHYRVAAPVRFEPRRTAMHALVGPLAREVLSRAGCAVAELGPEEHVTARLADREVRLTRATDLPGLGFVVHAPADGAAEVHTALRAAGAAPLSSGALDALRVERGRPWFGVDVTPENLLHETGLVREYHSPTKGCYVGQEVIARLEARGGHVSRALRGLRLSAPTTAGAAIRADGKDIGRVTTAAVSPRLGPIGMGYVHRSRFEPGTVVEVEGAPATVTALPLEAP
jgi:folate-binding protein YgfZ